MGHAIINIAIVVTILIKMSNAYLTLDEEDLRRPFDQDLYTKVLDPVACQAQLRNILEENQLLLLRFLDAGIRIPRGILQENVVDLGNYYQCLGIDEKLDNNTRIQGKYCMIQVQNNQNTQWRQFTGSWLDKTEFHNNETMQSKIYAYASMYQARAALSFEDIESIPVGLPPMVFRLAVCLPKPCTTEDWLSTPLFNVSSVGVRVQEEFCRLPNDKQWVAADTVAIVVFSLIGFLTLLSTCYDIYHALVSKRDPKLANTIYTSFSVFTNTHRILTFNASKGALDCLDGIRVLSMMWIIIGHTFSMYPIRQNLDRYHAFIVSGEGLWITTAPISVDTFFMIAGVLLVYTNIKKMNGRQ